MSGVIERVSVDEVVEVYLPLSRLLNLYVAASQQLCSVATRFLERKDRREPFVLALAGSVAVGKSTMGRIMQALLARWPHHPKVALVPTDGFLYPNAVLEKRGLMDRKGFPESYNTCRLLKFLIDIKFGASMVEAPVYSHFAYDILPGQQIIVDRPDILIIEGLNLLQPPSITKKGEIAPVVSDFFDFTIYLDADRKVIGDWYLERFMRLRQTAFRDPASYFHRYSLLSNQEAISKAQEIWRTINLVNLQENIFPTRKRANLILRKDEDHSIQSVALKKI